MHFGSPPVIQKKKNCHVFSLISNAQVSDSGPLILCVCSRISKTKYLSSSSCSMTHQTLWVILCRLPEKGGKQTEELVKRKVRETVNDSRDNSYSWVSSEKKYHNIITILTVQYDTVLCYMVL